MNLGEIRTAVGDLITDSGYSVDEIDSYVNEVAQEIAGKYELPGRKRFAAVTLSADESYVSLDGLSQGFAGRLIRAREVGKADNLTVLDKLEDLFDQYTMEEVGDVEAIVLEGNTLWYQKIPSEVVTVSILYIANPAILAVEDDIPDFVPLFTHRKLFVNGTAMKILDEIEESIENEKVGYKAQKALFDEGIVDLLHWAARNRKHRIDTWSD